MAGSSGGARNVDAGNFAPDIVSVLRAEHNRIRAAFAQAEADNEPQLLLSTSFASDLWKHEFCETAVFWDALRRALPSSDAFVQSALGDERAFMEWITGLDMPEADPPPAEDVWAWRESVLRHMEVEEQEAWPKAMSSMSLETLMSMGDKFRELRNRVIVPPYPSPSDSAIGDLIARQVEPVDEGPVDAIVTQ